MNSLMSLLVFAIVAALILLLSGRPQLARLILFVCVAGIVADKAADAVGYLARQQSAAQASARSPTTGYTARTASGRTYTVKEAMTLPLCEKGAPTMWLTAKHDELRLDSSPLCWSRKVCGGAGISIFSIRSRTQLAGCTWSDNPFWNGGKPLCFGPGPRPMYKHGPDCARVLGVGEYEFEGVFPASAY